MNNVFKNLKKPILIVGIGNPLMGDDGAGAYLVDLMTAQKKRTASINTLEVPENYMGPMVKSGAATILLVDAADMGEKPGTVKLYPSDKIEETGVSTHSISIGLIAQTLKSETGADVMLLGIQPKMVTLVEGLTEEVQKAVLNLVEWLE